jgi:hypothetical protein
VWALAYAFSYSLPSRLFVGRAIDKEDVPRSFLPVQYNGCVVPLSFGELKFLVFHPFSFDTEWDYESKTAPRMTATTSSGEAFDTYLIYYGEWGDSLIAWTEFGKLRVRLPHWRPESWDIIDYKSFGVEVKAAREVTRIDFDQAQRKDSQEPLLDQPGLPLGYAITAKTWDDGSHKFSPACTMRRLKNGYEWDGLETALRVKIGEGETSVDFSKIRRVTFVERGQPEARLETTTGSVLDVLYTADSPRWLAGTTQRFGPGRILLADVKEFEVKKVPAADSATPAPDNN